MGDKGILLGKRKLLPSSLEGLCVLSFPNTGILLGLSFYLLFPTHTDVPAAPSRGHGVLLQRTPGKPHNFSSLEAASSLASSLGGAAAFCRGAALSWSPLHPLHCGRLSLQVLLPQRMA